MKKQKKFAVNVGKEFNLKVRVARDWKVSAVRAVFTLLLLSGGYAIYSGDASLFEKLLDTIKAIAEVFCKG